MLHEKSCGTVVIDNDKVLLIKHKRGHWDFPKGHVEKNETEKQTAIRETKEETNIDVRIISDRKYIIKYSPATGVEKQVVFFVANKTGGNIKPQLEEVSEVRWLEFNQALKLLTYNDSKNVLKKVLKEGNI